MSNVDINVDRRTDGLTDGLTDGRTDGRTENRTPISHPATSRCDNDQTSLLFKWTDLKSQGKNELTRYKWVEISTAYSLFVLYLLAWR